MRMAAIAFLQKVRSPCENHLTEGSGFTAVGVRCDPQGRSSFAVALGRPACGNEISVFACLLGNPTRCP